MKKRRILFGRQSDLEAHLSSNESSSEPKASRPGAGRAALTRFILPWEKLSFLGELPREQGGSSLLW